MFAIIEVLYFSMSICFLLTIVTPLVKNTNHVRSDLMVTVHYSGYWWLASFIVIALLAALFWPVALLDRYFEIREEVR